MAGDDVPGPGAEDAQRGGSAEAARSLAARREALIAEIRDPRFAVVMRGYDRETVDAYARRVDEVVDELVAMASPDAAVRRALEQVGEETGAILQRANESAEQITARARAQAGERLQQAEREADALVADAQARVRQLEAGTEALWRERGALLEELRALGQRVLEVSEAAERRFPARMLRHPEEEEVSEAAAGADTARLPVVEPAEEAAEDAPAVGEEDALPGEPGDTRPPDGGGSERPAGRSTGPPTPPAA